MRRSLRRWFATVLDPDCCAFYLSTTWNLTIEPAWSIFWKINCPELRSKQPRHRRSTPMRSNATVVSRVPGSLQSSGGVSAWWYPIVMLDDCPEG
jgi:hypothetical protein